MIEDSISKREIKQRLLAIPDATDEEQAEIEEMFGSPDEDNIAEQIIIKRI